MKPQLCFFLKKPSLVYLCTLLQGKALEVIHRMNSIDANDFDKVKERLMEKFRLTREGFRQNFRNYRQFVAKISNYFERWIQLSRIGNTFDDLVDLIIREQVIDCCPKEMIAYLKEKECSSKQEHSFTAKAKMFSTKNGSFENRHYHYGDKKSSSLGEKRDNSNKGGAKGNVNSPSMNSSSGKGKSWGQSERNRNNGPYTRGCYTCWDSSHFS